MAKKQPAGSAFQLLKQALKNKDLGRLYMFHGEETFLLHHYLEQLKKQLTDELTEAFNFHKLTNETFDIQSFADSVENLLQAEGFLVKRRQLDSSASETDGTFELMVLKSEAQEAREFLTDRGL